MNVVSIWRNRSGLAWASCSCRKRAGSILLGAVIASFLLGLWKVIQKITRWPPLRPGLTRVGAVVHHLGGRHYHLVLTQHAIAEGNEIAAFTATLDTLPNLQEVLITADALHTQRE